MAFKIGHTINVGRKASEEKKLKMKKKMKKYWRKVRLALEQYENK